MPLTKATPNVLSPISTTNTPNSIVLRDNDGNFNAGTITGTLIGNASTATSATTANTASSATTADSATTATTANSVVSGSITNSSISATAGIVDTKLATISTSGKVANSATTATSTNTASAIVTRDGSGNFSAGTITAALSGNATSSSSCSGNAATASALQTARTISLTGSVTGSASFNGSANISIATTGGTSQTQAAKAWVNFNGGSNADISGTYTQLGMYVTVTTATAHNLSVGQRFYSVINSGASVSGPYTVELLYSSTRFRYVAPVDGSPPPGISGNITLRRALINSSYNVSSIAKNGTGDYTVNFATAMADANYSVLGTGSSTSGETSGRLTVNAAVTTPLTTSSVRVVYVGAAFYDPAIASIAIFGN